jgi:hypothetical protein
MRAETQQRLTQLLSSLGHKPLNRTWAKAEIFLGLLAAGAGLLLSAWAVKMTVIDWLAVIGGLLLFVLGGYLALAGSRSHLYQSNNELTAFLLEEIHRSNDKG